MELKPILRKAAGSLLLFCLLALPGVFGGSSAFAQQPKVDTVGNGQIAQPAPVDSKSSARAENQKDSAQPAAFGPDTILDSLFPFPTANRVKLSAKIDNTYCATFGVQCSGPGLSFAAAANNNRNPVRLGVQVLNDGAPITNLTDADVNIINPFVPAGGTAVTQLSCGSCFQNSGTGIYTIFVNPANGALWKSGSYFAQVQVKVGSDIHRALIEIEIPF
jgi:hypothetical protein